VAGSCKHGNRPSGSVTGEKLHDYLGDYQLRKDRSLFHILDEFHGGRILF
jgi:hypothetical protein